MRQYVQNLDYDYEEAIRQSLEVQEIPLLHITQEVSSDTLEYQLVSSCATRTKTFSGFSKECLLNENNFRSNAEKIVARSIYGILGDKYTYLLNYRGDNDIINPITGRLLEADIALINFDGTLKCVIEINGNQHLMGSASQFTDDRMSQRDSIKYITWSMYGIDVITVMYVIASNETSCKAYLEKMLADY